MIALLDYGAGNLTSVRKALAAAGAEPFTPSEPSEIASASAVVIPGVGHFAATCAISNEWRTAILAAVDHGVPLLGICLGMQFLFDGSDEAPDLPGLGLLSGRSVRLPDSVKVPHVGWNDLALLRPSRLLPAMPDGTQVYFTHSYAAPIDEATIATADHGRTFAAAVEQHQVFGVQFHPEKSGGVGLEMLRRFVHISRFPDFQISKSTC